MKKSYDKMDVKELVNLMQNHDMDAFSQLYERYANSIYYFGLKLAHNEADAKDIVQETFVQVQQSIHNLKEPKLFKVWLNRIAFSKATRLFSRNKVKTFDPQESFYSDHIEEERAYMDPRKQARFHSDRELLDHMISELPLEQQAVLILMYYEHHTIEEIAQIMNVPVGTIKSRLHTARNKLNECICKYEERNQMKMDFKEEALIPALCALYATEGGIVAGLPVHKLPHSSSSIVSTVAGKAAIISLTAIISTVGVCGIVTQKRATEDPIIRKGLGNQTIMHLEPYLPITYQNITYERADDVYYALLNFAHCERELKEKTKEELYSIQPLYESLKAYGSIYYEMLQNDGWSSSFEQNL